MRYVAEQHLHHGQFGYLVVEEESRRFLGGLGANYYRPWVFPLYTPHGQTVLQEFPYDHPFHNGYWVAQGPILLDGTETHFWPMPPMRRPDEPLFAHMGRMDCATPPQIESLAQGVRFTLALTWRDEQEAPVLDEVRTIAFYAVDDATVCEMTSRKRATYGALDYPQTKFGSIGIRVEPRLLPLVGGAVLASGGRRGQAEVALDQPCDYVAFENAPAPTGAFGVLLTILPDTGLDDTRLDKTGDADGPPRGPWFIRDYGLAYYNPTRTQPLHTPLDGVWQMGLRVVAYDGALTATRAQNWMALDSRC